MIRDRELDALWEGSAIPEERFEPSRLTLLPEPARRYLSHAVAPGAPIARAVRLRMHGELKLHGAWYPFDAEQVIRWNRGFIWQARAKVKGLPVSGSDRWLDGAGAMRWRLLGLIPIVTADGADISRSALGRVQIESVWLPTVLLEKEVRWSAPGGDRLGVDLGLLGHAAHLDLAIDPEGRLRTACIQRWGNPEEIEKGPAPFHEVPFGCIASEERNFEGITVPTRLRVGWFFGSERFETEGEFFRVAVDHAKFR
jgi:hypothetical protein